MSNFHFKYAHTPSGKPRHHGTPNSAMPPPAVQLPPNVSSVGMNRQGYSSMSTISQNALSAAWGGSSSRKRAVTEDEYFDDDEEEQGAKAPESGLAYIPAPGSPTYDEMMRSKEDAKQESEEEDDPLDAYMAGIEKQIQPNAKPTSSLNKPTSSSAKSFVPAPPSISSTANQKKLSQNIRNDLEEEDDEESYYRYMEENPNAGLLPVDDDNPEIEYDEDGNPIAPEKKRIIDPLPPINHDDILYEPFRKDFYVEHEEISQLNAIQVADLLGTLGITVSGRNPPKPVCSFGHFNLDDKLLKSIIKSEFTTPTPIQSQAVPCALLGRDILGIAQTGSGKTVAFLWPMLMHCSVQDRVQPGEGPIALILAPTRELALQIYAEARKFAKVYDLSVICAYGGGNKWEQTQALAQGADIVVATPGRIIDHIKGGATNLSKVTFLVLDEADRMFELGFEPQVRSVCNHVRPDRQTLLFSATFRKRIEKLAKDALSDPVRISQGTSGQANEDITQHVLLLPSQQHKKDWLLSRLVELLSAGSVLLFVTKKLDAEQMAADLRLKEVECLLLHGDMLQTERTSVIVGFKKGECPLLVATDVAARGLDIPHVRTVINYDLARDIDTHTHRIGRTGRAGTKGTAYTLLTPKDKEFVGHIVRNLEEAHQHVPEEVLKLALQSSWFKSSRFGRKKDQGPNVGGMGLGFIEKGFTRGSSLNTTFQRPQDPPPETTEPIVTLPTRGPATDRLSAMKAAFKTQYSNQFTACTDAPPLILPPGGKKKRSRWE